MKNKILFGVGLLLLFGASAGGSYLFYWSSPDWQTNADAAATGVDEDGYPWLGAKNPKMVIHEYLDYTCPHCPGAHKVLRSAIAKNLNDIRLVRHDYARTQCFIASKGQEPVLLCPLVRASVCASKHISFWKWNDAIIEAPRHELNVGMEEYVSQLVQKTKLPKKVFMECYNSEAVGERAQSMYEDTKKAGVSATPSYVVDGQVYSLKGILEILDERGY